MREARLSIAMAKALGEKSEAWPEAHEAGKDEKANEREEAVQVDGGVWKFQLALGTTIATLWFVILHCCWYQFVVFITHTPKNQPLLLNKLMFDWNNLFVVYNT